MLDQHFAHFRSCTPKAQQSLTQGAVVAIVSEDDMILMYNLAIKHNARWLTTAESRLGHFDRAEKKNVDSVSTRLCTGPVNGPVFCTIQQ